MMVPQFCTIFVKSYHKNIPRQLLTKKHRHESTNWNVNDAQKIVAFNNKISSG